MHSTTRQSKAKFISSWKKDGFQKKNEGLRPSTREGTFDDKKKNHNDLGRKVLGGTVIIRGNSQPERGKKKKGELPAKGEENGGASFCYIEDARTTEWSQGCRE